MNEDVRVALGEAFALTASVRPTARAENWTETRTPSHWSVGSYDWTGIVPTPLIFDIIQETHFLKGLFHES